MSGTASRPVALAAAARLWGLAVCAVMAAAGLCGCRAAPQPSRDEAVRGPTDVRLRRIMVDRQIRARGVKDERVLAAMEAVPRAEFVPAAQRPYAYDDRPLPIGEDQTISQPYIVALMTEMLDVKEGDRVLEIGTGSGYQAAVLAELTAHVYTIEIIPTLAERAEETLRRLGYDSVEVKAGDGYLGWPDRAPFDGIIVTCAPEEVPEPLKEQLREGGRMVIPVGPQWTHQTLYVLTKNGDTLEQKEIIPVRFVPMVR